MAKRNSNPNHILTGNQVWDASADTYSHTDIKAWLDRYDQIIGSLLADRVPLGAVMPWSFPDKTSPDSSALSIPDGWALCNGQTLTSSQHDFPAPFAGVSVVLPDYRNRVLLGADTGGSIRTAGTVSVAPKLKGRQGANTATVPDHSHDHTHTHRVGGVAGQESHFATTTDSSSSGLNDPPSPGGTAYVDTDASGTGTQLARRYHSHQLAALYSSGPRDPDNASSRVVDADAHDGGALSRVMTSLQKLVTQPRVNGQTGDGNTGSTTTTPGGGTPGDDLDVNTYQASEGVYYLMKVKLAGNFTKPWTIRDSASSTASVGS